MLYHTLSNDGPLIYDMLQLETGLPHVQKNVKYETRPPP